VGSVLEPGGMIPKNPLVHPTDPQFGKNLKNQQI
jgi:hypothetical protein